MATNKELFNNDMNALSNAINEKTGGTEPMTISEMLNAVKSITSGGVDEDTLYTELLNGVYGSDSLALISFTISGTSYQAKKGMTWQRWVNSDYNTNNKYKPGGGMPMYIEERAKLNYYIYDTTTNSCINKGNTIKANGVYSTKYVDAVGGGNN